MQTSNRSTPNHCTSHAIAQVSQKTNGSFNEARNGSADSGQSSSPDESSSNVSLADSLDDQATGNQNQAVGLATGTGAAQQEPQKGDKLARGALDYDDAQTIKNYQEAALANNKISTKNNNNNDIVKTTTPTAATQEVAPGKLETDAATAAKQTLASNLGTPTSNEQQQQKEEIVLKQQPQKNVVGNINNNNYSGLNLNMTASEMRELIARRKKFDPKKAQINIRQKYEIIQQM